MDIQATKLEMMQLLLSTQKEDVLQKVKDLFEQEAVDIWDELDLEEQAALSEGLTQLDNGQRLSQEQVREEIKKKFDFDAENQIFPECQAGRV